MQITDAEFFNAGARIEHRYEQWGRPFREVATDPLSYRWMVDYYTARRDGADHETAMQRVERAMDRAAGVGGEEPAPVVTGRRLQGQLRISRGTFVDDAGPVLPVFCHFGEAFSAFVRRPNEVREQLSRVAAAGYQGIRFWDHLGYYDYWRGREVTWAGFVARGGYTVPATERYYEHLEAFLRTCQQLGLAVHHARGDCNALSSANVIAHSERVMQIYDRIGRHVCALYEGNNEDWQNGNFGPDKLRAIVAPAKARGILTTLSSPPDSSEEADELDAYTGDIWTVHGYRQGEIWDRIRHIFSIPYEGKPKVLPGWQGEPSGPGDEVTVGQTNNPNALVLMALMSAMSQQGWVYMSGRGVKWTGALETQAGFAEVPAFVHKLPADLMSWPTFGHGGSSWKGTRIYGVPGTDETRADFRIAKDGRFMLLLYGPRWKECFRERQFTTTYEHTFGNDGRLILGTLL